MKTNRLGSASPAQHSPAKDKASPAAPSSSNLSVPRSVAGVLGALSPRNGSASMQHSILSAIAATADSVDRISLPNKQQPMPSVSASKAGAATIASNAPRVSLQKKAELDDVLQRWLQASIKKNEASAQTPSKLPPGAVRTDIEADTGISFRDVIIRAYPGKPGVYDVLNEDGTLNERFTVTTRANGQLEIAARMKAGAIDDFGYEYDENNPSNAIYNYDPSSRENTYPASNPSWNNYSGPGMGDGYETNADDTSMTGMSSDDFNTLGTGVGAWSDGWTNGGKYFQYNAAQGDEPYWYDGGPHKFEPDDAASSAPVAPEASSSDTQGMATGAAPNPPASQASGSNATIVKPIRCKHKPGAVINYNTFIGCNVTDDELTGSTKRATAMKINTRRSRYNKAVKLGVTTTGAVQEKEKDVRAATKGISRQKAERVRRDELATAKGTTRQLAEQTRKDDFATTQGYSSRQKYDLAKQDVRAVAQGFSSRQTAGRARKDASAVSQFGPTATRFELEEIQAQERAIAKLDGADVNEYRRRVRTQPNPTTQMPSLFGTNQRLRPPSPDADADADE